MILRPCELAANRETTPLPTQSCYNDCVYGEHFFRMKIIINYRIIGFLHENEQNEEIKWITDEIKLLWFSQMSLCGTVCNNDHVCLQA